MKPQKHFFNLKKAKAQNGKTSIRSVEKKERFSSSAPYLKKERRSRFHLEFFEGPLCSTLTSSFKMLMHFKTCLHHQLRVKTRTSFTMERLEGLGCVPYLPIVLSETFAAQCSLIYNETYSIYLVASFPLGIFRRAIVLNSD